MGLKKYIVKITTLFPRGKLVNSWYIPWIMATINVLLLWFDSGVGVAKAIPSVQLFSHFV